MAKLPTCEGQNYLRQAAGNLDDLCSKPGTSPASRSFVIVGGELKLRGRPQLSAASPEPPRRAEASWTSTANMNLLGELKLRGELDLRGCWRTSAANTNYLGKQQPSLA